VADVSFNLEETSPEVKIDLNRPRLSQLGTNPGLVTSAISTYFMGTLAGTYLEKGDEYNIRVRSPADVRNDVERLKNAPIFLATGAQMPLASVALVSDSIGPTKVSRKGQRRVLSVAVTKTNAAALGDLTKRVEAELKQVQWPEDAVYAVGGSAQDMKESFMYLGYAFAAALLLVYMVMASQFESLLEPFVIMFTVPLAAIGVAGGLYLTKTTISVTAAIGIVMLAGIVVNNAIVLIDFIKQEWDQRWETLIEVTIKGGQTRPRPILMTTLTTVLALLPLALGIGEGAETWAPMAITVMGGLTTSTLLTLFVVPCWYVIIAGTLARRRARKAAKLRERIASQQGMPAVG